MTRKRRGVRFGFPEPLLPDGVKPGSNILVVGSADSGARELALGLLAVESYRNEGQLLLSADICGRDLLEEAAAATGTFDPSRAAVIDCSGIVDEEHRFDHHNSDIDGPGDLLGIEMEFATLYETLRESGYERVRIGVFSVSSLLADADLRTVSRFVHMLTGRIIATGDLGVFHIDSSRDDAVTVDVMERFCDRRIDVRRAEDGTVELRSEGHGETAEAWETLNTQTASGRHQS